MDISFIFKPHGEITPVENPIIRIHNEIGSYLNKHFGH